MNKTTGTKYRLKVGKTRSVKDHPLLAEEDREKSLITKIMVWIGMRSECCNAKIKDVEGWNQSCCVKCQRRV